MNLFERLKPLTDFSEDTQLCIDLSDKRLYVVKHLPVEMQEIYQTIAEIRSPHLAAVAAVDLQAGEVLAAREYISGMPLDDLLKDGRTISQKQALNWTEQICDGLLQLHQRRLVHRDVNPHNIIISSDGVAKLIDFGIARSFSGDKNSDTVILGTPGYAAPEQFGFAQSNSRTDIYAVGVLLNVMLTGCLPNQQTASGATGRIVRRCTAIDAQQRFHSVEQLKDAIQQAAGSQDNGSSDPLLKHIPGLRSRHLPVVILAAIGYLAAGVFTIAWFASMGSSFLINLISWCLILPIPYTLVNNLGGLWDKFPLSRGSGRRAQRIVYCTLAAASVLAALLVVGTAYQPSAPV